MGQIVDKAASLRRSNELGPPRTISKAGAQTHSGGNYMMAISRLLFLHISLGQIINVCRVKAAHVGMIW